VNLTRPAALASALLICAAFAADASAAAKPRLSGPWTAKPTRSAKRFHDVVLDRPRRAWAAQSIPGGLITTATGEQVNVYHSSSYASSPEFLQSWADFFAGLMHGEELRTVTVYLAPYAEMQALCESADADACYLPSKGIIFLPGETPPDGAALADIAAHEYGHHVAANRNNAPWNAGNWGPKYWSSRLHVCENAADGLMYPGDEGDGYALNPAEGWAETYRVLNGYNPTAWPIVDADAFQPGLAELDAARRDVLQPWEGPLYTDYRGRMRGGRGRVIPLRVQNDGTVLVTAKTTGNLDVDLYLYAQPRAKKPMRKANGYGRRETLRTVTCGYRRVWLYVYAYRGSGSYKVRATLPWNNEP
jgi:hypothetical protein